MKLTDYMYVIAAMLFLFLLYVYYAGIYLPTDKVVSIMLFLAFAMGIVYLLNQNFMGLKKDFTTEAIKFSRQWAEKYMDQNLTTLEIKCDELFLDRYTKEPTYYSVKMIRKSGLRAGLPLLFLWRREGNNLSLAKVSEKPSGEEMNDPLLLIRHSAIDTLPPSLRPPQNVIYVGEKKDSEEEIKGLKEKGK